MCPYIAAILILPALATSAFSQYSRFRALMMAGCMVCGFALVTAEKSKVLRITVAVQFYTFYSAVCAHVWCLGCIMNALKGRRKKNWKNKRRKSDFFFVHGNASLLILSLVVLLRLSTVHSFLYDGLGRWACSIFIGFSVVINSTFDDWCIPKPIYYIADTHCPLHLLAIYLWNPMRYVSVQLICWHKKKTKWEEQFMRIYFSRVECISYSYDNVFVLFWNN